MAWRFRNTGSLPWPRVELCCSEGDPMSFTGCDLSELPAGQHIDVPVIIHAPNHIGHAGGAFRLRSEFHGFITDPLWIMLEVNGPLQPGAPQQSILEPMQVPSGLVPGVSGDVVGDVGEAMDL